MSRPAVTCGRKLGVPVRINSGLHFSTCMSTIWLNDNMDSVCVLCAVTPSLQDLQSQEEPLENNWALAPMDQWKR